MKSFKAYITEARMTSRDEVVGAIKAYKKAGEILNPQYIDLKKQATRLMEKDGREAQDSVLNLTKIARDENDDDLLELYYTSFDSFVSHNKIEKLLNKLEKKNKPHYTSMIKSVRGYLSNWKSVGDDLKELKDKIVKVTQKRAEAKVAAETSMKRKFADSSSLIKIFESHLNEYKEMARKQASQFIEERLAYLKKHDWDLNKAVPRVKGYYGSSEYKSSESKRALYRSITKAKDTSIKLGAGDIRVPNKEMIDRYIESNVKEAEAAYRSFMQKMIEKIGKPIVNAKMTGNIWTNAVLTVTTDDGEEQVWNTKMIINFSKYQNMFNQFPTRRKK